MKARGRSNLADIQMSAVQSLIFTMGLLSACFLATHQVVNGGQPVGKFVTLLTYWAQITSKYIRLECENQLTKVPVAPLTFFGRVTRDVATHLVDAERLLQLFRKDPLIKDKPQACNLELRKGDVELDGVSFAYDDRKPILKDISLKAKGGSTIAFVGQTGGGKSTILKLLFRFYDVAKGSIKIDGIDIRDVTLNSLRDKFGVVPQDPSLFNDTIMMNLKYAKLDCSDDEVYAACKAAAIHDKIMTFPEKYMSKVGERGVRLSGGELQRVCAIQKALRPV